jgi:Holliday junction resolvase-like predicted endonuclease
LEIDIIAKDVMYDTIVFVEVKQHARHDEYDVRLRGVDRRKKELLRRACRTWLLQNRNESGYRFDVIEVFGEPYSRRKAEIDHIVNVRLFVPDGKFVDWAR